MLVPWLLALDAARGLGARLLLAGAMTVAFALGVFGWFAPAVSAYTGWPQAAAVAALLAAAPLLQPQFLAFALARHLAGRHPARPALAIAAWLATEWALPRLFGDTLGHGLHPAPWLRQGADLAGAAGLTLVLLAGNEALARAIAGRRAGLRAWGVPLAVAAGLPLLLAGYGAWRLATLDRDAAPATVLRVGLVQADLTDYARLRRERGTHGAVRHVLDTHFALSLQARGAHGADVLVWSETVYPAVFGAPRGAAGADYDREIVGFARHAGVPLVFGTYARDAGGEYNAAAFVDPREGPLGAYRKTRLFPLSEYVPPALDGPALRRALPWLGTWRPGDGARVFPLRTPDGREVPVLPLICRDAVDPRLAIDGARLGAQLLVGLSNDAWFTRAPQGARLHLAVAAFRSVETRLPQVRATTNGVSAVIDARGEVLARTAMGERTVLVHDVAARAPAATPVVRLGPWLGPLAALVLTVALGTAAARRLRARWGARIGAVGPPAVDDMPRVLLLTPARRVLLAALRAIARAGVLALALAWLLEDGSPARLAQLRQFALLVLLPEALAWGVAGLAAARARIEAGQLVIDARRQRIEIPLGRIARVVPWRLPLPMGGLDLALASGARWPTGLALRDPAALAARLQAAGAPAVVPARPWRDALDRALALPPAPRLDHPLLKFGLFPLVPALPAFRLHQHIAYGGSFGEWQTFGAAAWLGGLALWWASWAVALVLLAGALRAGVEAATAAALAVRPARAVRVRAQALAVARLLYYLGVPAWLALRLLAG